MSNYYTFDDLWDQACEGYLRSTDRAPLDRAVLKRLHNTDDLLKQLEARQSKFSDWKNKHPRTFSALSKAIRPFELFLNIAQTAVSATPFAPASTVLGALLFIVEAANGVSEAYEWIEQLFDKLGEFTVRLAEYLDGGMNTHLQQKIIAILSCLLEILGRSEKVIRDGRFRKFTAVLFLGKDEQVKTSFDRLSKLMDDEQRLILAISYATNQRIDRKTDKIDINTERTAELSERMEKKLDEVAFSLQGTRAFNSSFSQVR
jgi:fungal STAND N-terminal Goodbye domain